jgi:type IV pilus assembly protein PilE
MILLSSKKGFTFIELLIIITIVGILLTIAYPSYTQSVRKSKRSDASTTISQIQLAQEAYRSNNTTYGTLAQVWGGVAASPQGYYTLAVSGNTATGYTITATALGDQLNDIQAGTSCTPMQLVVSGLTETKTPAACW